MNKKLLLGALVALAMPLAFGCDDITGDPVKSCALDADCTGTGEICHPDVKICVPTCTASSDCTNGATCSSLVGITAKICTCTGNTQCNSDQVCHLTDKICEVKCAATADCSSFTGRSCTTATGQCDKGPAQCSPTCTAGQSCVNGQCVASGQCTTSVDCINPSVPQCNGTTCGACTSDNACNGRGDKTHCELTTGACVVPAQPTTCNVNNPTPGSKQGPDTCNYGQNCVSGSCQSISNTPQCAGFTNYPFFWDPTNEPFGPVILTATAQGFSTSNNQTECGDGGPKTEITITFYAPNGWTHGNAADVIANRVTIIKPDGNTVGLAFFRNLPPTNAKTGTFVAGSCGTSNFAQRAIYMTDQNTPPTSGNIVCL